MATSILQGLGNLGSDIGKGAGIVSDENRQNAEAQLRQLQAKMQLAEFQQKVKDFQERTRQAGLPQYHSTFQTPDGSTYAIMTDKDGKVSTSPLYKSTDKYPEFRSFDEMATWATEHGDADLLKRAQQAKLGMEKPAPDKFSAEKQIRDPKSPTGWSWQVMNESTGKSGVLVPGAPNPYVGKTDPAAGGSDAVAAYAEDLMARRIKVSDIPVKIRGQVVNYIRKGGLQPPRAPTAEEHRRADLAVNVNENLEQIEDIVKRRPELFGPGAGWLTGARHFFGTNDPDISALYDIKDNLGRAAQGAHGMRSARGVADAANAVLNNLKNGPKAVAAAASASRRSVATFLKDVGETPGGDTAPDDTSAPASLDDALDSIFGPKGGNK